MSPDLFLKNAVAPALDLLPVKMDTPSARALIVAICLQESRLQYRRQVGGPARSYAQFEMGGGVRGVLNHPASKPHIQKVLVALDYDSQSDPVACYTAIEHNDILAAAFARLLLYTSPETLPLRGEADKGWSMYAANWRPGRPRRDTFDAFYAQAWALIG